LSWGKQSCDWGKQSRDWGKQSRDWAKQSREWAKKLLDLVDEVSADVDADMSVVALKLAGQTGGHKAAANLRCICRAGNNWQI
jgi:hypothetical protein